MPGLVEGCRQPIEAGLRLYHRRFLLAIQICLALYVLPIHAYAHGATFLDDIPDQTVNKGQMFLQPAFLLAEVVLIVGHSHRGFAVGNLFDAICEELVAISTTPSV